MAKICFDPSIPITKAKLKYLDMVSPVLEYYEEIGHTLTLRQLHYQLVGRGLTPNTPEAYRKLMHEMTAARWAGLVDWDAIEDRTRNVSIPYFNDGVSDAILSAVRTFRLDRQRGQENYIEVWVEKEALSSVLERVTRPYGNPIMANRGFSSTPAMYASACRFREALDRGQKCVLLYLGDHDPSGQDMSRDIQSRLARLGLPDIEFRWVGLTLEQVKQYDLIPAPVKEKDSRSDKYVEKTGLETCWELDALDPLVLEQILDEAIREFVDMAIYQEICDQEQNEKLRLLQYARDVAEAEAEQ